MSNSLTTHIPQQSLAEASRSKADVEALMKTPGWKTLLEVIEARQRALVGSLTAVSSEHATEYARIVGEIAGLRSVEAIAQGVVDIGTKSERRRTAELGERER